MKNLNLILMLGSVFLLGFASAQPLTSVEGVIELRPTEDVPWQPASVGDVLEVGGSLRTFQGDVVIDLESGGIRLAPDGELARVGNNYRLVSGKAYLQGDAVFQMAGPVRISGEARFDASEANGERAVLLSGEGRVTVGGSVVQLTPMQQLVIPEGGAPSLSTYFENDPWYLDLVAAGVGIARVIGFEGGADMQFAEEAVDDGWEVVQLDAAFEPIVFARTADDSWLEVRFDDGNLLRLQADTELVVQRLEEFEDGTRRSLVQLRKGKIWAVVEGDGQPFEIETPGLVAGVRGTKLRVDAATDDEPPLLKTFEGEVAAVIGFETFEVTEGQQFDPEAGVEALVVDELDEFNLGRDVLVIAPDLTLSPLPSVVADPTVSVSGETDGLLVSAGAQEAQLETPEFTLNVPLKSGVNIVEVRSQFVPGGAAARSAQPVVRAEPDAFLDVREPERLGDLVRLQGVATPGSTLEAQGAFGERRTVVSTEGRFRLILPLTADLTLTLTSPLGAVVERTLDVSSLTD